MLRTASRHNGGIQFFFVYSSNGNPIVLNTSKDPPPNNSLKRLFLIALDFVKHLVTYHLALCRVLFQGLGG